MKKLSQQKMITTITTQRRAKKITQAQLAEATGMNRGMIGRLENSDYIPTISQLQSIAETLDFEITDLFEEEAGTPAATIDKKYNIAVAGTGYVGLSIATLLAQHNHVVAVDIDPKRVDLINQKKSTIQDEYIENYLTEKDLDITATLDGETAYKNAEFVIIAAPTNYDSQKNFFDCSAVESVIELVLKSNPDAMMIIKSTIPVGYTESARVKYNTKNIIFSPEFLRESKALYDNLYPSRIIIELYKTTKITLFFRNYTKLTSKIYSLHYRKKRIRPLRIKNLITSHHRHQILRFTQIYDIMRPPRNHMNSFNLIS